MEGPAQGDVVERAQAGDPAAFAELYERWHRGLRTHLYRLVADWPRAEELTQDAFVKAWQGLPATGPGLPFPAWLYRIGTNVGLDHLRHERLVGWQPWDAHAAETGRLEAPDRAAHPEGAALDREAERDARLLLAGLPLRFRRPLALAAFGGLDADGIGAVLGQTRAQLKNLLSRARAAARTRADALPAGVLSRPARPAPPPVPGGIDARWNVPRAVWRYHVCVDVRWARGGPKTTRHFGTYDGLPEAVRVLRRERARLAAEGWAWLSEPGEAPQGEAA